MYFLIWKTTGQKIEVTDNSYSNLSMNGKAQHFKKVFQQLWTTMKRCHYKSKANKSHTEMFQCFLQGIVNLINYSENGSEVQENA